MINITTSDLMMVAGSFGLKMDYSVRFNLKLRDEYDSLSELCSSLNISSDEVISALNSAGYKYDEEINQFI